MLAWLVTWPLRTRLSRNTARIERETVQQAQTLKMTRELKSQEEVARKRIAANPQDFGARMALASALARQRQYPAALQNLREAQRIDPGSAAPHAAMGQLFDASSLHDLSIEELRKAVAMNPDDLTSLSLLAYKYVAVGWNRPAEELLTRALEKQPDDVRLHVTLALVDFQNNQTAAAEQNLLTARRLAPKDPTVIAPLIEVYRHAQRYKEALQIIDQAMPVLPDKQVLLLERAQMYQAMERPEEAIATADQVLQMSPGLLDALYIRAVSNKMKENTDEAIRDLEAIRAREPRMEQTLLLLGQLYLQKGESEQGKLLLAEYNRNQEIGQKVARLGMRVASQPDDWKSHLALGEYYCRGGSYARAIVELKRTLELKPGQKDALPLLVKALQATHRDQEAEAFAAQTRL